jgi:hypothetical protein
MGTLLLPVLHSIELKSPGPANPRGSCFFGKLAPRTKCNRKGRYSVTKLIEEYGRKANMMKWREQLNGDCPKRDGRLTDRCDLICPDLPMVL